MFLSFFNGLLSSLLNGLDDVSVVSVSIRMSGVSTDVSAGKTVVSSVSKTMVSGISKSMVSGISKTISGVGVDAGNISSSMNSVAVRVEKGGVGFCLTFLPGL